MYVLDSSALIELVEAKPRGKKISEILGAEPLTTTTICMHELIVGAQTEKQKAVVERLAQSASILEHTLQAARAGAIIEQELLKERNSINAADILIAGICKANNKILLTCDNDFTRIKNLQIKVI